MGLDLYVGSLTRYYIGEWETIVQKYAKQEGLKLDMVRPESEPDAITDPDEVIEIVDAWMLGLGKGLESHLPKDTEFYWQDDMSKPYFTDKPTWDCYGSMLLWAAYSEHPEFSKPTDYIDKWNEDPAFQASVSEGFKTKYGQLLHDTELWLPVEFQFSFKTEDPTGNKVGIGSCFELFRQLKILNEASWCADQKQISLWRKEGADYQSPLEIGARFSFSAFYELCKDAVINKLPMKLDY